MATAILIKHTGEISLVNPTTLADYQALVGGYIEKVSTSYFYGHSFFVNEDGIALGLPVNPVANFVAFHAGTFLSVFDSLKGDVLLVGPLTKTATPPT